jgi:hypothetical protein
VTWNLVYLTRTEEENIVLRHHMELLRLDRAVVAVEVTESAERPMVAHVQVTFRPDRTEPDNLEMRGQNRIRGTGTLYDRSVQHLERPDVVPIPPEIGQSIAQLSRLVSAIPRALEPTVNALNSFFTHFTPPPALPEPERKTAWEIILSDDDYPV